MARFVRLAIFVLCFLTARAVYSATYYVDCAGGNDNNNGTSQATPWLHAPGMPGFSHSGYAHSAGDRVIFKGGVICPVSYFPWTIPNSGTSSSPDYYGVDQTWYTGTSWARPIFDGANTGPNGNFVNINGNYVTLDNIEMRNQGIPPVENFPAGTHMAMKLSGSNLLIDHIYIHGYKLTGSCVSGWWNGSSWTPASDYHDAGIDAGPGNNNTIDHLTFDGSDSVPAGLGNAVNTYASPLVTGLEIRNSVIHDLSNALCCGGSGKYHHNNIYHVKGSCNTLEHENVIETLTNSVKMEIYDNEIHDNPVPAIILICANAAVYNNAFWNNGTWPVVFDDNCGSDTSYTAYAYNNTIQLPSNVNNAIMVNGRGAAGIGGLVAINNHLISEKSGASNQNGTGTICFSSSGCDPAATHTLSNNVFQTNAQATSSGYTSSETNPYSPLSANSPTVGTGANETSLCGTYPALCYDLLDVARPPSGAWDSGTYMFSQNASGQPNPPTNLTAVVH